MRALIRDGLQWARRLLSLIPADRPHAPNCLPGLGALSFLAIAHHTRSESKRAQNALFSAEKTRFESKRQKNTLFEKWSANLSDIVAPASCARSVAPGILPDGSEGYPRRSGRTRDATKKPKTEDKPQGSFAHAPSPLGKHLKDLILHLKDCSLLMLDQ